MYILWVALLPSVFAASLLPQHFKPGRYSNGTCLVLVELDREGKPLVELTSVPGHPITRCASDVKVDCGELRIPFRARITEREITDFSLYPRPLRLKNFEKRSDGSIALTVEAKETAYFIVTAHHSELSLELNAQGEPTEASGFWAFNNGGLSTPKANSRVLERCKNLKPVSDTVEAPEESTPQPKAQPDGHAIK